MLHNARVSVSVLVLSNCIRIVCPFYTKSLLGSTKGVDFLSEPSDLKCRRGVIIRGRCLTKYQAVEVNLTHCDRKESIEQRGQIRLKYFQGKAFLRLGRYIYPSFISSFHFATNKMSETTIFRRNVISWSKGASFLLLLCLTLSSFTFLPAWPSQQGNAIITSAQLYSSSEINETSTSMMTSLGRDLLRPELILARNSPYGNQKGYRNTTLPDLTGPRVIAIDEIFSSLFCVTWDVQTDGWWTHHPEWEVSTENDTHFCFQPIENPEKVDQMLKLYAIQFQSECSTTATRNDSGIFKEMISSGWAADWMEVIDGLQYALEKSVPFSVFKRGQWHYAHDLESKVSACERKDPFCYFLNITICNNKEELQFTKGRQVRGRNRVSYDQPRFTWLYDYATRPQQWLRREIYAYIRDKAGIRLVQPCTVLHVRRADVVLHNRHSRRYHAIKEYVDAANSSAVASRTNFFLLTDDQNAIEEARSEYPNCNWMYFDRPRYRGAEGGFEKQLPSKDPKSEVSVLLSTLKMVKTCNTLIHSTSGLADLIRSQMVGANYINIDSGKDYINNRLNKATVNVSRSFSASANGTNTHS